MLYLLETVFSAHSFGLPKLDAFYSASIIMLSATLSPFPQ